MVSNFLHDRASIEKYWNEEAVLFSNQDSLSAKLPPAADLISFFTGSYLSGQWAAPLDVTINASNVKPNGGYQQLLSIDINAARSCYLDGFSLCFGDLSLSVDQVADLKAQAAVVFGYPELIAVTGYLSPPGAVGVLHFDRQHNFFIQREGSKRWFVSETAAVKNPHENLIYAGLTQSALDDMKKSGYKVSLPKECGIKVFELNPGDILYIPPGFYHSPETLSEPSLHYTLTIEPMCFWKDFNKDMFSKLLLSEGRFFQDYRFLNDDQKLELTSVCQKIAKSSLE
jgi:hypothetical protein